MSMNNSFGGGVDLAFLRNQQQNPAPAATPNSSMTPSSEATGRSSGLAVPALVLDATPATLASYVKLSEQVPVLVEFYTARSAGSAELSATLATDVNARNGQIFMLRIDGDHEQANQLLRAFQVEGLPAVCALLQGQPIPLFTGNQQATTVKQVLDKLILLARENGISQSVSASSEVQAPVEPQIPQAHIAAYEAMEAEDYAKAVKEWEAVLSNAPADAVAPGALAQAKLLLRTEGLDISKVLETPAEGLADVLQKADVLTVIGHFEKAFTALLDTFEVADKVDRDVIRTHLLELFKVAGAAEPSVGPARTRLTNLLY